MNRAALSRRAHYDQGPSLEKLAPVTLVRRAVFAVSHRRNHAMPADRELHLLPRIRLESALHIQSFRGTSVCGFGLIRRNANLHCMLVGAYRKQALMDKAKIELDRRAVLTGTHSSPVTPRPCKRGCRNRKLRAAFPPALYSDSFRSNRLDLRQLHGRSAARSIPGS